VSFPPTLATSAGRNRSTCWRNLSSPRFQINGTVTRVRLTRRENSPETTCTRRQRRHRRGDTRDRPSRVIEVCPSRNASAPEMAAALKDASAVSLRRKSVSLDCVSTLDGTSLITLKRTVNSFSSRSISCAAPLRPSAGPPSMGRRGAQANDGARCPAVGGARS
jgi:hypothetical protein